MKTHADFRKYAVIPITICLAALLASAVFFVLSQRDNAGLNEIIEHSGEFIYRNMTAVGAALDSYSETGDKTYLRNASTAACKAAAVCASYGDASICRAGWDMADNAIQDWGIVFLIRTYHYLNGLLEDGVDASDAETIRLLADAYRAEGETVTFMSLFQNASSSALKDRPEWTGMNYMDGQLQWPEF